MLIALSQQAMADFAETIAPFGLPVHLARTLLLLGTPTPMRAIADHLACDPSYVTSLADKLEERGLAERTTGADRRVKLLALTDEGAELKASITEAVAANSMMLLRLDDQERALLAPLLEKLLGQPVDLTAAATHTDLETA